MTTVDGSEGDDQEQFEALLLLEESLERQREQDWANYAQALTANIEQAGALLDGLRVPVVVRVSAGDPGPIAFCRFAWRLLRDGIEATPAPGGGHPPLQRALDCVQLGGSRPGWPLAS